METQLERLMVLKNFDELLSEPLVELCRSRDCYSCGKRSWLPQTVWLGMVNCKDPAAGIDTSGPYSLFISLSCTLCGAVLLLDPRMIKGTGVELLPGRVPAP